MLHFLKIQKMLVLNEHLAELLQIIEIKSNKLKNMRKYTDVNAVEEVTFCK